jgi:predicted  nucleic acid-binding Zn-ribbon protein
MTTKSKTKPVAKTTTTVAKKATEQTKRPTIKSLQEQQENLTKELMYANSKVVALGDEVVGLQKIIEFKDAAIFVLQQDINALQNRSILTQILFAVSKPFK